METRQEVIAFCKKYPDVMEDYPFHDDNWTLMRHRKNKKAFALVFERMGKIWINVKCDTEWRDFWRQAHASVLPAYHMNKEHWNSIILDGTIPDKEIVQMIAESFELTKPAGKRGRAGEKKADGGRTGA